MNSRYKGVIETSRRRGGTLLYVTDLVHDSNEALDVACDLAANHGISLELIHVIDLEHARSSPDGQMSIQFRLETLGLRLRHIKRNVVPLLLFGSPEEVISKRAKEIKAKLIAFAFNGHQSAGTQAAMAKRVQSKVACPVMILPAPAI